MIANRGEVEGRGDLPPVELDHDLAVAVVIDFLEFTDVACAWVCSWSAAGDVLCLRNLRHPASGGGGGGGGGGLKGRMGMCTREV